MSAWQCVQGRNCGWVRSFGRHQCPLNFSELAKALAPWAERRAADASAPTGLYSWRCRHMPLAPGARLGPYELTGPLASGGMGEVFRARDTRLEREVAVKVIAGESAAGDDRQQRFHREARAIAALSHPHICTVHDVGTESGIDYLVLELLTGESLASRLRRGPLPLDEALHAVSRLRWPSTAHIGRASSIATSSLAT